MMEAVFVRPATAADAQAITLVCLLTADAGRSAVDLLMHPELPSEVWALPYIALHTGFGFVMVAVDGAIERIVGYIIGTRDTSAYERAAEEAWWPALRLKYPLGGSGTPLDTHYTGLVHKYVPAPDDILAFSRAHIHINILPEYRRQGWGRRLMDVAVQHLQDEGLDGLWVGSNGEGGRTFYKKLGFTHLRDKWLELKFDKFLAPDWPCRINVSVLEPQPKCCSCGTQTT